MVRNVLILFCAFKNYNLSLEKVQETTKNSLEKVYFTGKNSLEKVRLEEIVIKIGHVFFLSLHFVKLR